MHVRSLLVAAACGALAGAVVSSTSSAGAQPFGLPGGGSGAPDKRRDAPPVVGPSEPADATTAAFGDASRRAWVAATGLKPPFGVLWRATVGGKPGSPLVAGGLVFDHVVPVLRNGGGDRAARRQPAA